ncbi:MAG: trypsin-like peptidase domain-containing protein [Maricaulaceae bacterium]
MASRNLNRYFKQGIAGLALAAAISISANAQVFPTSAETTKLPAPTIAGPITPTAVNAQAVGLPSIADLVESVTPAVVNVIARLSDGQTTSEGQGSGFIISAAGEVVTNFHVIEGATTISIAFGNGVEYPVSVIGTDEETDLAVLKIQANHAFPYVEWHNGKDVRIGEWVVAIGNPFGIGQSTSLGVISAIGRERVDSGAFVEYIQTDATINRGNSGGPLFDLHGHVVGVNSAIYSPTGASVGIAFVIPHYTAAGIIDNLRRDGVINRGFLGAALRSAEYTAESDPTFKSGGATVNSVVPGSPAEQYGLQIDDVILSVNGVATRNSTEATREIAKSRTGDKVTFVVERVEKLQEINVIVGERPGKEQLDRIAAGQTGYAPPQRSQGPSVTKPAINLDTGVRVVDLSSTFRDAIGMRPDQVGVYVESVDQATQAPGAGFRAGMVLLEAEGQSIADSSTFKTIILNAKSAKQRNLSVKARRRNGSETYLSLPL